MQIATPQAVFVRRYGEHMYLFNQCNWASVLLRVPDYFDKFFDRRPKDIDDVAKIIASKTGIAESGVKCDIMELLYPLMQDGYIVSGNRVEVGGDTRTDWYDKPLPNNGILPTVEAEEKQSSNVPESEPEAGTDALMKYFMSHPTPFELCIDLTKACTARCVHCYVPEFENVSLPLEMVKKVLQEFKRMGGLKVKFTGGECMLHKDFVEILEEARMTDLVISVLSNLSVCGDKEIDAIKRCDVAVVQCSLYGADAKTHEAVTRRPTFNATARAMDRLIAAGVPVQIHCPVMKQNYNEIDEVRRFGKSRGIKVSLAASIMSRADHDVNNQECELSDLQLREYIKTYEGDSVDGGCDECCIDMNSPVCEIGTSKLCLSASGEYYPCNGCYDYKLGNCQSSLEEVWNGEPVRRLRAIKWKDMQECTRCKDIAHCVACPSRNFNSTMDFTKPDPAICRIARIRHLLAKEDAKC